MTVIWLKLSNIDRSYEVAHQDTTCKILRSHCGPASQTVDSLISLCSLQAYNFCNAGCMLLTWYSLFASYSTKHSTVGHPIMLILIECGAPVMFSEHSTRFTTIRNMWFPRVQQEASSRQNNKTTTKTYLRTQRPVRHDVTFTQNRHRYYLAQKYRDRIRKWDNKVIVFQWTDWFCKTIYWWGCWPGREAAIKHQNPEQCSSSDIGSVETSDNHRDGSR